MIASHRATSWQTPTLVVAAFAAVLSLGVDYSWTLWSAGAPWVWEGFQSAQVSASEVCLGLISLAAGISLAIQKSNPRRSQPTLVVPGAILVMAVALSVPTAAEPNLALARLADVGVGFLAGISIAREPRLRYWIVVACLVLAAIELPLVVAQQVTQSTYPLHTLTPLGNAEVSADDAGAFVVQRPNGARWQRSMGSFPHPNVLGGFAATVIVLALPLLMQESQPRWPALAAWIAAWIELTLSFSRAGALAAFVGCSVWLLLLLSRSHHASRLPGIGAGLAFLSVIALASRSIVGDGVTAVVGPAVSDRLLLVQIAATMFQTHPIFGVGAGNFAVVEARPPFDGVMVDPVHLVPLLVAAETGVFAALAWFGLVLGPPLIAFRSKDWRLVCAPHGLAMSATILVLGGLDHYLWTLPPGQALFWIAVGAGVTR